MHKRFYYCFKSKKQKKKSLFLGRGFSFFEISKFLFILFDIAKTNPNHKESYEFYNVTKKMCSTPYPYLPLPLVGNFFSSLCYGFLVLFLYSNLVQKKLFVQKVTLRA